MKLQTMPIPVSVFIRRILFVIYVLTLIGCNGCSDKSDIEGYATDRAANQNTSKEQQNIEPETTESPLDTPPTPPKSVKKTTVGFFSPGEVDHQFVPHVKYSILEVYPVSREGFLGIDIQRLRDNFYYVKDYNHRINLDLSPTISDIVDPDQLNISYIKNDGALATKLFSPMPNNKLRTLVSNEELERRLAKLPGLVKEFRNNIGCILIIDEPYLNGVSPDEIDRVILKLKSLFAKEGISDLEYGVIFASAMFNPEYAQFINSKMMDYVENIDNHYRMNDHLLNEESKISKAFQQWVSTIRSSRLTTYDSANNMYLAGGIPREVDLVSFDFYLSTILFDTIHENTLDYFYQQGMDECASFEGTSISEIKSRLSFIKDGPVQSNQKEFNEDKKILNEIFDCRMSSATYLLKNTLKNLTKSPKVFMIGESSANGLLEFDSTGRVEENQPDMLVEKRIFDEVERSFHFYQANRHFYSSGLYYFLYPDSYDTSINLKICGAEGAHSVLEYIYGFSQPAHRKGINFFLDYTYGLAQPFLRKGKKVVWDYVNSFPCADKK